MARHHESKKARHHEHMGMERYERGPVKHGRSNDGNDVLHSKMSEGYYSGEYARRTQEMEDGDMIREDMRAVANLPQEVMYKPYPMEKNYLPEGLDDSIRGVDYQESLDDRKRSMNNVPKKV